MQIYPHKIIQRFKQFSLYQFLINLEHKGVHATFALIRSFYLFLFHWRRLILFISLFAFIASTLRVYQLNLKLVLSDRYTVYYDTGAILLEKEGVIGQYFTRRGTFFTDYLHSLYEPQLRYNGELLTIYRQQTELIKWREQSLYTYFTYDRFIMTDDVNTIDDYKKNLIVGPNLTLYGARDSIFVNSPSEIINSYFNNEIYTELNCTEHELSNCEGFIDKYTQRLEKDPEYKDSFIFTMGFHFNGLAANNTTKAPVNAFIFPETFELCNSTSVFEKCRFVGTEKIVDQDNIPVYLNIDGQETQTTFQELEFDNFHLINLKVPDYLVVDQEDAQLIDTRETYYMVHPQKHVWIGITPLTPNVEAAVENRYRSMRFESPQCPEDYCELKFRIQLGETNVDYF